MHYLDYNEKKSHGTPDFPIEFYHVTRKHPRYYMPFHWHKEIEFVRVLEGSLTLYLDSRELNAGAGDIVFINEGVIHGAAPRDSVYQCVVFDLPPLLMNVEACRKYIRSIRGGQIKINDHFPGKKTFLTEPAARLFQVMERQAAGYELTAIGLLYEVFGIIFHDCLYAPAEPDETWDQDMLTHLKVALEYIDRNFSRDIRLEDLSKEAGLSAKYLCRYFQAVVHRSPIEYLNFYRIEQACGQFCRSDKSITEVAYACGFNDTSYFIKTFKKFKGITPRHYQRLLLDTM